MLPFLLQALAWCTEDYYAIALWCKQTLEMLFAILVTRTKPFALLNLSHERDSRKACLPCITQVKGSWIIQDKRSMLGKYRGGTAGFPFMRIPRFPRSPFGWYKGPGAAGPPCSALCLQRTSRRCNTSYVRFRNALCGGWSLSAWGQVERGGGSQGGRALPWTLNT